MNVPNLIERLNNELDKLNKLKNEEFNTNDFFTDNEHFNDSPEDFKNRLTSELEDKQDNETATQVQDNSYQNIEPDNETKSLVIAKSNLLITAQTMFKKTIKFSLKSFLISISLSFLNLFI